MNDRQQTILKELLSKYFEGGNSDKDLNSVVLKSKIDAIKDFVRENFN